MWFYKIYYINCGTWCCCFALKTSLHVVAGKRKTFYVGQLRKCFSQAVARERQIERAMNDLPSTAIDSPDLPNGPYLATCGSPKAPHLIVERRAFCLIVVLRASLVNLSLRLIQLGLAQLNDGAESQLIARLRKIEGLICLIK